jgi:hypothetical protein
VRTFEALLSTRLVQIHALKYNDRTVAGASATGLCLEFPVGTSHQVPRLTPALLRRAVMTETTGSISSRRDNRHLLNSGYDSAGQSWIPYHKIMSLCRGIFPAQSTSISSICRQSYTPASGPTNCTHPITIVRKVRCKKKI